MGGQVELAFLFCSCSSSPWARCSAAGPHELWHFKLTWDTISLSMIKKTERLLTEE